MEHRAQIMMLPGALNVWELTCQRAAQLVWLTTLHWHGVKKTFYIYITMSWKLVHRLRLLSVAPRKTEPQNVLVSAAFPRQHWQQHPQEESVRAPVLRPLRPSRPLGVARAHHSTNGAAGLRWVKNAPVTIWRSSIFSTHSRGLPSALFAVHFSAERSCRLLGLVFMLIDVFDVAHKLWSIHDLNLNSFGCEHNLHRFCC